MGPKNPNLDFTDVSASVVRDLPIVRQRRTVTIFIHRARGEDATMMLLRHHFTPPASRTRLRFIGRWGAKDHACVQGNPGLTAGPINFYRGHTISVTDYLGNKSRGGLLKYLRSDYFRVGVPVAAAAVRRQRISAGFSRARGKAR